jgi:hypothetical protein
MPTTFEYCGQDVVDVIDGLAFGRHQRLADNKVTIKALFAVNPDGDALKHHGWPSAAVIKINSLKDRVEGKTDCTLTIDKEWWDGHDEQEHLALIDHELTHLEFRTVSKKDQRVKLDDVGRPVMRIRQHDFQVGGFDEIVGRYGMAAEEAKIVIGVQRKWIQAGFDFGGNDQNPSPEKKKKSS